MGIWIPRAKPEESKFTYAPKPRFITGLNYDFDLPGEKIALLYQQATRNSAKHTNSVINGASFAA